MESVVLGGGCFWCLEAVYQRVSGVKLVTNGYTGGTTENPTYDGVSSGRDNHAEVVKLDFDPKLIKLEDILSIFWVIHDPTTQNRQGNDIGSQYRSTILYEDDRQLSVINNSIEQAKDVWGDKITTEIKPLQKFWPAESYHQNYFNNHPDQAYCQLIINPKVTKLKKQFSKLLKN